ncbi:lens fiber major intrinsic protein-like [Leptidea sinapis]|uniref:lens fiber major intrinsic protein-like n=1 Tax=Leptidea sinapis TaxID=189913 RepID=UPI0021336E0F|nr:lens fiber major intrinsic protein-like [Leptidea sinapis]
MPADGSERGGSRRGVSGWLCRWWRALLAEVISTALLVLLGIASILPKDVPLTNVALAFGFVVLINIEAFGPVSGAHMNPAVTLAATLYGRLEPLAAVGYLIAQIIGATLGFGALMGLAPEVFKTETVVGGTAPVLVGESAAMAVEAVLTGCLALLCCSIWAAEDAGKKDPTVSIKFAFTIAGLIYAGGALTGASLNPVRSLAPALLQRFVSNHWVYWVGPLGGSAVATLLHRYVLRPSVPAPAPVSTPEQLPLHLKADH